MLLNNSLKPNSAECQELRHDLGGAPVLSLLSYLKRSLTEFVIPYSGKHKFSRITNKHARKKISQFLFS